LEWVPNERTSPPAVVAAFLIAAEGAGENYKFLNAALRALDLMDVRAAARCAGALRQWCQTLLARVG